MTPSVARTIDDRFHPPGPLADPRAGRVERLLARLFWHEDIHRGGDLYMRRFIVWGEVRTSTPHRSWTERLTRGWRLYLHCFYRSDDDPDPHCHPADFYTWVWAGGYDDEEWWGGSWNPWTEQMQPPRVVAHHRMGRFAWARRPAEHIHRVRLHRPDRRTWTVVLFGPRRRAWHFYTPAGRMGWREYLALHDKEI